MHTKWPATAVQTYHQACPKVTAVLLQAVAYPRYNALAMSPVGGPWLPGQPGYVHQRGDFQPRVQQLVTVKGWCTSAVTSLPEFAL